MGGMDSMGMGGGGHPNQSFGGGAGIPMAGNQHPGLIGAINKPNPYVQVTPLKN